MKNPFHMFSQWLPGRRLLLAGGVAYGLRRLRQRRRAQ